MKSRFNDPLEKAARALRNAAAQFVDEISYTAHGDRLLNRAVRECLGQTGLADLRQAVAQIAPILEAEDLKKRGEMPFRSAPAVIEDDLYFLVKEACAIFEDLRRSKKIREEFKFDKVLGPATPLICTLGKRTSDDGRNRWAKLIAKLSIDGAYWAQNRLGEKTQIYALIAVRVQNEQDKREREFRERVGVMPAVYLDLSNPEQISVCSTSGCSENESVEGKQATLEKHRAERIKSMIEFNEDESPAKIAPKYFKSALTEIISTRLKSLSQ
ncbi:MAG TPA: hypothetical protein VFT72_01230 [Opitutaceae bacterium]|nr:hypothetical protein [Opitutaceae bacterium]